MDSLFTKELTGIILITGSLAFSVAAFMPVSRLFGERSPEQRLAIIEADRSGWVISQFLFALGAAVSWIGMLLLAYQLNFLSGTGFALPAVVGAGIGMLFWLRHVYLRGTSPQSFTNNLLPGWHFLIYALLTGLALIGIGVGLFQANSPDWLALVNVASAILFALIYLIFKDLPPFLFYLVTLVDGIALLFLKPF